MYVKINIKISQFLEDKAINSLHSSNHLLSQPEDEQPIYRSGVEPLLKEKSELAVPKL